MASIKVTWGPFLKLGERWTPSRINQIFEGASFELEGAIGEAQKPPDGIDGDWMGDTFITDRDTTLDPQGDDWVLIHDTSVGNPHKVSITNLLSLGFASASPVTTLTESDEFNVLVGGAARKISLPNVRNEIHDATNALTLIDPVLNRPDLLLDRLTILDTSATESKRVAPANLVRSVTDRVVPTSGSNAYVVTSGFGMPALVSGLRVIVKFHQAPLPGATLAVDGLPAKALRTADDGAIVQGAWAAGRVAELIYDPTAAGGAGGWLVQGILAVVPAAHVVVNLVNTHPNSPNRSTKNTQAVSGQNLTVNAHGFVTGRLVWLNDPILPAEELHEYYVIVVDANTIRLATSKANAAAGIGLPAFTGTWEGELLGYYLVDPILSSVGVDGVIWRQELGAFWVDFASDRPNANYPVLIGVGSMNAGESGYGWLTAATTGGFAVLVNDINETTSRLSLYCP
ncbi:MAG TPA: hypothetical protein VIY86_12870 [Pirellulaceae bacterium]